MWVCIIRFLSKYHRLHNAEDFSSVLRFRCSNNGEFFRIFARPNNLTYSRLGFIVAGKVERLAVNRNRVKRLLRELFRVKHQQLSGLDFVVRLQRRLSLEDSARARAEADLLMTQLLRCRD